MSTVFQAGRNLKEAPGKGEIYGVTWDGSSSTALTRTDSAVGFADPVPYVSGATSYSSPFDDIMPWKGMVKVEDSQAGTLVEIPKFWYKLTKNGNALSIQIANYEADGFACSPAHMDRGDRAGERDTVYIGRYHCNSTDYKSTTGLTPKTSITRSTARTNIHNLGTTIWQYDFTMRFTLWLLYIVEFANWDSQRIIGYGTDSDTIAAVGSSDSMPYHTGTMKTARTTSGRGVQYRWIEGLWENAICYLDGCWVDSSGIRIILNPNNFSDSSGGTSIGMPISDMPSALGISNTIFPVFYPTASGGSTSTYIPDSWYINSSAPCLASGNDSDGGYMNGLFMIGGTSTTAAYSSSGCRLMKLP